MIGGTAYGVILNDRVEREQMGAAFASPPYNAPPVAPVLYIKPRNCFSFHGAPVALPDELDVVEIAPTVGLLFDERGIAATCLALDVSIPHRDYYRPAIAQRCRDSFLPIGAFIAPPVSFGEVEIITHIDGRVAHRWSLDRLARSAVTLIEDITAFMTLTPGDLLLVGLPADAPVARAGQQVEVSAIGFPPLKTDLLRETS